MTTLRVNAIGKTTGTTVSPVGGLCKSWSSYVNDTGQNPTNIFRDSFNTSGVTDLGTGASRYSFVSAMGNAVYGNYGGGDDMHWGSFLFIVSPERNGVKTTLEVRIDAGTGGSSTSNRTDETEQSVCIYGQLA